ncbi:hypothetical protein FQR65_LT12163 [Abscondita terminalis]|nr:hypothetical protein FQR65_LT12163 [Abscondita terminalis]
MRHVVSVSVGTLLWAVVLIFSLKPSYTWAASEESLLGQKSDEDTPQLEGTMLKKDWSRNLHSWGKRAWSSLQGGWGKRDSLYYPYNGKRAWQSLQGGWGKRYAPEDEYASRLAAILEQEEQEPQYNEFGTASDVDGSDGEKRAWKGLSGGWGKRSDGWANFRGSWGKRDPAWTNLKDITQESENIEVKEVGSTTQTQETDNNEEDEDTETQNESRSTRRNKGIPSNHWNGGIEVTQANYERLKKYKMDKAKFVKTPIDTMNEECSLINNNGNSKSSILRGSRKSSVTNNTNNNMRLTAAAALSIILV